jgi:hypothetical protein
MENIFTQMSEINTVSFILAGASGISISSDSYGVGVFFGLLALINIIQVT